MSLLLSHWHCILPAVGIIAAAFLLREKPEKQTKDKEIDKN